MHTSSSYRSNLDTCVLISGMMGLFDGDPTNDVRHADGTVINPNTSTEAEIRAAGITCE